MNDHGPQKQPASVHQIEAQCEMSDGLENLLIAAVRAFHELNTIRARDGVPYTRHGWASDVDEAYFSSVVDALDDAVTQLTGHSAHCHPLLYRRP